MAGSKLWRQWPKSHLYHPTHRPQATIPKVPVRRCAISLPSTSLSPAWLALVLETCLPTRRLRSSSLSSWWSLDVSYFLVSCFYFACFYSVTARRKKQHFPFCSFPFCSLYHELFAAASPPPPPPRLVFNQLNQLMFTWSCSDIVTFHWLFEMKSEVMSIVNCPFRGLVDIHRNIYKYCMSWHPYKRKLNSHARKIFSDRSLDFFLKNWSELFHFYLLSRQSEITTFGNFKRSLTHP